jgi:2,3,4,5-tetrahydropyridine-2,6-dicarboxylate N-succinyltransferase
MELQQIIEAAWTNREQLKDNGTQSAIRTVIEKLDKGEFRVAEPVADGWKVNEWIKKAVILYFPIQQMETIEIGPLEFHDKMKLKRNYKELGVRVVPHAVARYGAYLSKGVILMPSYVNIGSYVDEGTMLTPGRLLGVAHRLERTCT